MGKCLSTLVLGISLNLLFFPVCSMQGNIDEHYSSEHCLDELNREVREAIYKELAVGYSSIEFLLNTTIVLRDEGLEKNKEVHTTQCTLAFTLRKSWTSPFWNTESHHHTLTPAGALVWLQSNAESRSLQTSCNDVVFRSFAYEANSTGEEYIINITIPSIAKNPLIPPKMSKYLIPNS